MNGFQVGCRWTGRPGRLHSALVLYSGSRARLRQDAGRAGVGTNKEDRREEEMMHPAAIYVCMYVKYQVLRMYIDEGGKSLMGFSRFTAASPSGAAVCQPQPKQRRSSVWVGIAWLQSGRGERHGYGKSGLWQLFLRSRRSATQRTPHFSSWGSSASQITHITNGQAGKAGREC